MATATAELKPLESPASSGHAAHTKTADTQEGLRGKITRPINITFLGAGSGFCPTLCRDVLLIPGNQGGELRLCDLDAERLATMHKVIEKLVADIGQSETWKVRSSTNRRELLTGTTYAVCCIEVSGLTCVGFENDIPLKYGIDQCIGDTVGPGGLFKGLRSVPVFLDVLRDMRDLCPRAIMLNYTNPMSMMILAAGRAVPEVQVVGLCHSVQGTSHLMAEYAGVPYEELDWECAGVNHLAWFTRLEHKGENLYTKTLFKKFDRELAEAREEFSAGTTSMDARDNGSEENWKHKDLVRKDMCVHFGAFITESSGHLSEYLPYYRKNDDGKTLLRTRYDGGSRFYATNWPNWRKGADAHRNKLLSGEEKTELKRSWEYASWIIEACEKDSPYRIHGNVMNHAIKPGKTNDGEAGKLITNLDGDGAVEVSCMVDRNGINPTRYGALPPQMAHICHSQQAYFDLAAKACIEKSVEASVYALMLDPLTAAICTPRQIKQMTLEIFKAEKDFLPGYK